MEVDGRPTATLRWMLRPIAAVAILPYPTLFRSFSTHPPIALQSFTQDEPFFPGGDGETIVTSASEVARLVSNLRDHSSPAQTLRTPRRALCPCEHHLK